MFYKNSIPYKYEKLMAHIFTTTQNSFMIFWLVFILSLAEQSTCTVWFLSKNTAGSTAMAPALFGAHTMTTITLQ